MNHWKAFERGPVAFEPRLPRLRLDAYFKAPLATRLELGGFLGSDDPEPDPDPNEICSPVPENARGYTALPEKPVTLEDRFLPVVAAMHKAGLISYPGPTPPEIRKLNKSPWPAVTAQAWVDGLVVFPGRPPGAVVEVVNERRLHVPKSVMEASIKLELDRTLTTRVEPNSAEIQELLVKFLEDGIGTRREFLEWADCLGEYYIEPTRVSYVTRRLEAQGIIQILDGGRLELLGNRFETRLVRLGSSVTQFVSAPDAKQDILDLLFMANAPVPMQEITNTLKERHAATNLYRALTWLEERGQIRRKVPAWSVKPMFYLPPDRSGGLTEKPIEGFDPGI